MNDIENIIRLAHGGGGKLTLQLIKEIFLPAFKNSILEKLEDSARINFNGKNIAFTIDAYTVNPIFFPGGDIGKLAITGTINDLAMQGGIIDPFISAAFIIEEGFEIENLEKIVKSMKEECLKNNVKIVAGDTKVVEKGLADKIYIITAGISFIPEKVDLGVHRIKEGDAIIVSGTIGDHGAAILSTRYDFKLSNSLISDCASLKDLVKSLLENDLEIHCLRDPTRGGLGTILNEIALKTNFGIIIDESKIPIKNDVRALCEILGIDPLYLACEGRIVCFSSWKKRNDVLSIIKENPLGENAMLIGRVTSKFSNKVIMKTTLGVKRIVSMFLGENLPRIC
jgi:hydrogenase expression/formation protein HypE